MIVMQFGNIHLLMCFAPAGSSSGLRETLPRKATSSWSWCGDCSFVRPDIYLQLCMIHSSSSFSTQACADITLIKAVLNKFSTSCGTYVDLLWLWQDRSIGHQVVTLTGAVPAANFLQLPQDRSEGLGLTGKFLYLQVSQHTDIAAKSIAENTTGCVHCQCV